MGPSLTKCPSKPWDGGSQPLFSLAQAHRGSQLVGQPSPRKGKAGPDTVCFAHVLISRAEQSFMFMPEAALLLRAVSDAKQSEKGPASHGPELLFSGSDPEPGGWTLT